MKTKEQHAKFFCENCGAEVPENARVCKYCGRFFSSVRCPQCGTSGTASMFDKGCPVCGYAVNNTQTIFYNDKDNKGKKNHLSCSEKRKLKSAFNSYSIKNRSVLQNDNSLPLWIYIITAGIFVAVLTAVYSCFK
jgi:hypothetical protein